MDILKKDMEVLHYPEKYDSQEIQKAISRLSGYLSRESHQIIENLVLTHEDPAVRVASVQAISTLEFNDVLMTASKDEDETVREAALLKMTEIENENAQEKIFENRFEDALYSETDEDVINAVISYFENYSESADEFISTTYNLLFREDLPPTILLKYAEALTEFETDFDMFELLTTVPGVSRMESNDLEMLINQISKGLRKTEEESVE